MGLVARSFALFVLAGLCEIGGGQPAHFGRVYAAYGGIFVVLSMLWGWTADRIAPDRFDVLGGAICLAGVAVIMYWPR